MVPDGIQFIQPVIGIVEEQDVIGAFRAVVLYNAGQVGKRISFYPVTAGPAPDVNSAHAPQSPIRLAWSTALHYRWRHRAPQDFPERF